MFEVVYGSHLHHIPIVLETFNTEEAAKTYCQNLLKNAFDYEAMDYWVRKRSNNG